MLLANSTYSFVLVDYDSSTMSLIDRNYPSVVLTSMAAQSVVYPNGKGAFHKLAGTSFNGQVVNYPLRKTLPTLADPATNLKYQIKTQ